MACRVGQAFRWVYLVSYAILGVIMCILLFSEGLGRLSWIALFYAYFMSNIVCLPFLALNKVECESISFVCRKLMVLFAAHSVLSVLAFLISMVLVFSSYNVFIFSYLIFGYIAIFSLIRIFPKLFLRMNKIRSDYNYFEHPKSWEFMLVAPWYILRGNRQIK